MAQCAWRRCLIAFLAFALSGCTKPAVVEWDIQTGLKLDNATGFYAYKTALPPRMTQDVTLHIAEADSILRREVITIGAEQSLYPAIAYRPDRLFVMPDTLAAILASVQPPEGRRKVELGYFVKRLTAEGNWGPVASNVSRYFPGSQAETRTKGVLWAQPSRELEKLIVEAVAGMQAYAASYGAHALMGIQVYNTENNLPYGGGGTYLSAKAVAYEDEPRLEPATAGNR